MREKAMPGEDPETLKKPELIETAAKFNVKIQNLSVWKVALVRHRSSTSSL